MILFILLEFATKLRHLTFISLVLFLPSFGGHGSVNAEPVKPDAFGKKDQFFRSTYNRAREQTLRDTGPIIFVQGEDLTLFYNGKSVKSGPPQSGYRTLTTVSHITLTIFLLLEPYGGEVLNLSVSATTNLTALWVLGALIGLVIASKLLKERKRGPIRSIIIALFVAIIGFCCVFAQKNTLGANNTCYCTKSSSI